MAPRTDPYEALVSDALARARANFLGISLEAMLPLLSEELGWRVTKNTLSKWEQQDGSKVPASVLVAAAKVANVGLEALVYDRSKIKRRKRPQP